MDPITAGIGLAGQAVGAITRGIQNKKSRQWSEKMYQRQFDDNVKFWNMQNEYNSPINQMQRLKEAGLNPAMIYGGQGSGAAGQAGTIQKADTPRPEFQAPDFSGIGQVLQDMRQSDLVDSQIDLLEAQKVATLVNAASGEFELGVKKQVEGYLTDAVKLQNAKVKSEIKSIDATTTHTLDKNQREALMNASNLREAGERILTMELGRTKDQAEIGRIKAAIAQLKSDTRLKQLEAQLRKSGITFNDNIMFRWMGKAVDEIRKPGGIKSLADGIDNLINSIKSQLKKF